MLLLTTIGSTFNSKVFLKIVNDFKIEKVVIVKESHSSISNYIETDASIIKNDDQLKSEVNNLMLTLKIIKSFNLDYSYFEIYQHSSNLSILAFLANIVVYYPNETIIDLSIFKRKYIPLLTQLANYLPSKVLFTFIFDEFTNEMTKFVPSSISIDPDKETSILKEILSLFIYKTDYYSFLHNNKERSSNIILNELNETLSERNLSRSYPYIQACLSALSQDHSGKQALLNKRHNSGKKRELVFSLTEFGLLVVYLWYQNQKSTEKTNDAHLYKKLDQVFNDIRFNEIKYEVHAKEIMCNVCNESGTGGILTCSFCGLESCKTCLNTHYLENDCQMTEIHSETPIE